MNLLFCLIGFNFMVLNDSFDFYAIGFELFNPCNHMFKEGVVPMTNVFRSKFSLVKILSTYT